LLNATNSASASANSKGALLVSAKTDQKNKKTEAINTNNVKRKNYDNAK
jgi:hypothetical protein